MLKANEWNCHVWGIKKDVWFSSVCDEICFLLKTVSLVRDYWKTIFQVIVLFTVFFSFRFVIVKAVCSADMTFIECTKTFIIETQSIILDAHFYFIIFPHYDLIFHAHNTILLIQMIEEHMSRFQRIEQTGIVYQNKYVQRWKK